MKAIARWDLMMHRRPWRPAPRLISLVLSGWLLWLISTPPRESVHANIAVEMKGWDVAKRLVKASYTGEGALSLDLAVAV